jgi:TolB-like protein/DNA-binding SARP family transcriptional activator
MPVQSHDETADGAVTSPIEKDFSSGRLRLSLLGPFQFVNADGQEIIIASKKNRLLLALLAMSPAKRVSREILAGTLWGNHSDDQAKNSLRQALAVLRKELAGREDDVFSSLDTIVSLNPHGIGIDVDDFKRDAGSSDVTSLQRAIGFWRGPFLADINAGEEYLDDWLSEQRETLNVLYVRTFDRLVPLVSGHEQIGLAQRLVNFDNLREASHRRLMEAYANQGERALALRHYEKTRKLLRDEVGVEPSLETQELRGRIVATSAKPSTFSPGAALEQPVAEGPAKPKPNAAMPALQPKSRRWTSIAAIAIAFATVAGVLWDRFDHRQKATTDPSVAVLPFENLSSDPAKGSHTDRRRAMASTPTIAVLPFDNLAGDETNGRIADGITDDIITELARFRDFDVIARNSTEVYKSKPVDVRQIGEDLNVEYVVTGSFQRQGNQLRINTQLIEASTGHQVFSQRFDTSQDLFAVQAEVATKIANSLGGWNGIVSQADLLAAKRKQRADLNAYALFLLGDEARRELTEESELRAVKILKEAIAADPTLARAHTSLAWTYARLMLFQTDMGPMTKLMLDESRRALELDPLDARAHTAVGYSIGMTGDLKQAEVEFDRALNLNPNSFDVLLPYSCWAFAFGKGQAGADAADRAIRLNPRYPDSGVDCFRYALFMVGRYEDAIRTQRRLPQEKWNPDGFAMTAGSLAALGKLDEANALATRGYAKFPSVLSVEKFALDRGWSPPESAKLLNVMQKAGFPVCATKADLADNPKIVRLPGCT